MYERDRLYSIQTITPPFTELQPAIADGHAADDAIARARHPVLQQEPRGAKTKQAAQQRPRQRGALPAQHLTSR